MKANDLMFGNKHGNYSHSNLTLRDHIAIEAMNGLCIDMSENTEYLPSDLAAQAYEIADAMIEESNKF